MTRTLTTALLAMVATLCTAVPAGEARADVETFDGYVCFLHVDGSDSTTVSARMYTGPGCTGTYLGNFYLFSGESTMEEAQYQRIYEGFLQAVTHDLHVYARINAYNLFGGTLRYLDYVRFWSD